MTDNNEKKETWDTFLVHEDDAEEGVGYIVPNIEFKLPKNKRQECREIVLEIRKFGVSQRQIMYLIYLMSLELEDLGAMRAIVKAIGENRENIPLSLSDTQKETPKIIIEKE
jgi:hypothetical protein